MSPDYGRPMALRYCSVSFESDNVIWSPGHPNDLAIGCIWSGWLMANVLCHPDDIRSFRKSSWWHNLIHTLSHPNELAPDRIASRWLMVSVWCHRTGLNVALCHPDEITYLIPKSSGWLGYWQYFIRRTYGHCRMSSRWHNLIWTLSHPDDLAPGRM